MASQSSIDQLARAWSPMRTLPRENSVSVFRGGTHHCSSIFCHLAKVPVAGGKK
jgi:hypothetical protein